MQRGRSRRVAAQISIAAALAAADSPVSASAGEFVLALSTDFYSDAIDRGITQTAHRPGFTGGVDLQKNWFYVSAEISNVKPPTRPVAEVALGAGIRPEIPGFDNVESDIGVVRYLYPRATPVDASGSGAYTEAEASVRIKLQPWLTLAGELAYSPNYTNTGARSVHTAAHAKIELPKPGWMPLDSYYVWSEVGRMQFGTTSDALGAFQLPSYTHWLLGIGFKKDPFTLELNYSNTNLSRENCFILTSDPAAAPGGAISDANPLGQRSSWCGPAFFAKLSFAITNEKR